jgi:formiminotetrahydrofolate cyclodeaminase
MLVDLPLKDFLAAVAARTPTPGGGSVAAAAAGAGTALGIMVARYSSTDGCARAVPDLEKHLTALTGLVDADAHAYDGVKKAMELPKGSDQRKEAMQAALVKAAEVPLQTMAAALDAMRSLPVLAKEGNTNLSSDLGGAVHLLSTGLQIAALNVQVNVASIRDKDVKQKLASRSSQLMQDAARLVQETLAAMAGSRDTGKSGKN